MRIEVWVDVVCPWCFIGKTRLDRAIAQVSQERGVEVEVIHRSFQLDPGAPAHSHQSVVEHLGHKYGGGPAAGQQMVDQVAALAAAEGLDFRHGSAGWGNTGPAHRLIQWALAESGPVEQGRLVAALFDAYFVRGSDLTDAATLSAAAESAGLDPVRAAEVLDSSQYGDRVEADVAQAASYGAGGVPFYVVGGRYGISGAQPQEFFVEVLNRVADEEAAETHSPA